MTPLWIASTAALGQLPIGLLTDGEMAILRAWAEDFAMAQVVIERDRWKNPAFLWPVAMPDDVARWLTKNQPKIVPRD